jgi:hypothetical protein
MKVIISKKNFIKQDIELLKNKIINKLDVWKNDYISCEYNHLNIIFKKVIK